MRAITVMLLALLLAACGGNNQKTGKGSSDDNLDFTTKPRNDQPDTRGNSGKGNTQGSDNGSKAGADNGAKTGTGGNGTDSNGNTDTGGEGRVDFAKPVARTDIEGKVTDFANVMALWDATNHTVRVVASTKPIPENQIARLRNGEPIEGETPHMILSWVLEEGATKLSMAGAENYFYDFYWLTSLSPMSLRNIGKEAVRELSGKAVIGQTVRVVIEFRSENVKDAPAEKVHFDFVQELKLQ